jgi:uncharacterized protein involved in exopolysaccharide biosynthesis/Mrp family chromosome partitioning ATPase
MELRKLWETIYRRKWLYLQSLGIIIITVILAIILIKPLYKSTAKILLQPVNKIPEYITNLPNNLGKFSYVDKEKVVDTFKSMLKLETVNNQVLKTLNIKNNNGKAIHVNDFVNPNIITLAINGKGVIITQENESEIFVITGISTDINEAVDIANRVKDSFVEFYSDLNKNEAKDAIKIMEKQINETKSKMKSLEEEKFRYDREMKIVDVSTQRTNYLSHIASLEKEKSQNIITLEENNKSLVSIKDTLSKQPEFKKSSMTDEMKKQYEQQLLALELNLSKLKIDYTPEHPEVKATQNQIDIIKEKFSKEFSKTFGSETYTRNSYFDDLAQKYSNIQINMILYQAKDKILASQIKGMYKKFDEFLSYTMNVARLQRELDNQTSIYTVLNKQLENAKIATNINVSNAQIIQNAQILGEDQKQYRYFPKRKLITIIAFIVGNFLSFSIVFIREYLDNTLRNTFDLETTINAPIIESISIKNVYTDEKPFWNILSYLSLLSGGMPKTFSIISTGKDVSKSFIAAKLAQIIADKGYKTLLVDFNLKEPSIANLLGISTQKGIINWLTEDCDLKDIIVPSGKEKLEIIPSVLFTDEPLKYLASEKITKMVDTLKQIYDVTIFNTAPLMDSMDTMILSTAVKKVVFIGYQGKTPVDITRRFIHRLYENNVEVLGTVFISI